MVMGIYTASELFCFFRLKYFVINLQATKVFLCHRLPRVWVVTTPLGNHLGLKISYRVIQRLIQHCFLSKMVYLYVKYMIAARNYAIYNTSTVAYN